MKVPRLPRESAGPMACRVANAVAASRPRQPNRFPSATGTVRRLGMVLLLATAVLRPAPAAVHVEDFATDPEARGWRVHGDPSPFAWDALNAQLEVTWDSTRPNAFFFRPLDTVLTRSDDFRMAATLRVSELATSSPQETFQIAFGLLRRTDAFRTNFFRGAGIHPLHGARNLVEFAYFPASETIAPTFSAVAVGTNYTRWATVDLFPLELILDEPFRVEVRFRKEGQVLSLRVQRDGEPYGTREQVLATGLGDFRLDAFAIAAYSGEHQPAGYGGQIRARGSVDDVEIETPDPPRLAIELVRTPTANQVSLPVLEGWRPRLQRSRDLQGWDNLPIEAIEASARWIFEDREVLTHATWYRVELQRP